MRVLGADFTSAPKGSKKIAVAEEATSWDLLALNMQLSHAAQSLYKDLLEVRGLS